MKNRDTDERVIRNIREFEEFDGRYVTVVGKYHSIPKPRKGISSEDVPKDHATLILDDGANIFIEPIDSPKSIRTTEERNQFEARKVYIRGIAHKIMPSSGQSLINPCISDITSIS
jgi:hypothetical protein